MNSRFFSILELVNLKERLILPNSVFPTENFTDIDYEGPMGNLNIARKETQQYLKRSLG